MDARPVGLPHALAIFLELEFYSPNSLFFSPTGRPDRSDILLTAAAILFTCFRSPGDRSNRPVHAHSEETEPVGPTGPTHTEDPRPVGPDRSDRHADGLVSSLQFC